LALKRRITIDERFERIEHYTAGLAEERRKDREEYKALWRDTQRKIDEIGTKILQLAEEGRENERRMRELWVATDARFRETDARFRETDARIAALVSAIGQHVRQGHPQQ
jgi:hypothetical protein